MGRNDQPDRGGSDPFDRRQRMKVQNASCSWNLREKESACNRRCSDHPGHAPAPVRQKRDQAGLRHDERHQRYRSCVRGSLPSLYGLHEKQEERRRRCDPGPSDDQPLAPIEEPCGPVLLTKFRRRRRLLESKERGWMDDQFETGDVNGQIQEQICVMSNSSFQPGPFFSTPSRVERPSLVGGLDGNYQAGRASSRRET